MLRLGTLGKQGPGVGLGRIPEEVEAIGDLDKPVSKIGIGTGCICSVLDYLRMGCDCCIVCDDGSRYDEGLKCAADLGVPAICVNHAASEEPGMVTLTQYINDNLPGLTATHLPQGSRFRVVGANGIVS